VIDSFYSAVAAQTPHFSGRAGSELLYFWARAANASAFPAPAVLFFSAILNHDGASAMKGRLHRTDQ
jgi:hypothetical protein